MDEMKSAKYLHKVSVLNLVHSK